jgi:HlyD family secretion protein/macrolide-specific efflux system membrane fusion protein
VILAVGGLWAGTDLFGSSGPQYRTIAAFLGTVQQTTSLSGTIEPVTQANLNFATSGTVATVEVKVGQKVHEGAVLATLQTADLSAQVDQATSALDAARSTLQNDVSPSGSRVVADETTVTTAQNTLTNDETALSDASTTNQMGLVAAQSAAQSSQTTLSNEMLQLENDQSALAAAQAKEGIDCQGDALAGSSTCTGDESTVTSDETQVTTEENNVASDRSQVVSDENNVTLTQLRNAQTIQQDQRQVTTDRSQLTSARANLQTARDGTYGDQLASDRASVASAESSLATAQQNMASARLVSPISGTVIAVSVTVGGAANAVASTVGSHTSSGSGTSSPAVEVVSPGTFEVQATASDSQVSKMKVGDQVVITPSGATSIVLGTVTLMGSIATVSSGVVTFPVTIGVKGASTGLYEGASAQLTIFVLQVKNVLTVPSSAVHTLGPKSFVYLLSGGKEVAHPVAVGAVGGALTQIKAGLTVGEKVVLADLSAGVPGVNSSGNNGGFGPGGGNVRIIGPGGGVISVHSGPKGGS